VRRVCSADVSLCVRLRAYVSGDMRGVCNGEAMGVVGLVCACRNRATHISSSKVFCFRSVCVMCDV